MPTMVAATTVAITTIEGNCIFFDHGTAATGKDSAAFFGIVVADCAVCNPWGSTYEIEPSSIFNDAVFQNAAADKLSARSELGRNCF